MNEPSLSASVDEVITLLNPVLEKRRSQRNANNITTTTSTTDLAECSEAIVPQRQPGQDPPPPIIIGLTGLQGSGKSTWASLVVATLRQRHRLNAISVSLDDFYWPHERLTALRQQGAAAQNALLRTRGQPGTHDEGLASAFFAAVRRNRTGDVVAVPAFDKSCFGGLGDRVPEALWRCVELPVDVVVFEGWCVGFSPLAEAELAGKYRLSADHRRSVTGLGGNGGGDDDDGRDMRISRTDTLADHDLEHLLALNTVLDRYCSAFMGPQCFDCLVHLDTDRMENVFGWRRDQERDLIARTGCGMDEAGVDRFVRGYMPAYELYLDQLRGGFFDSSSGPRKTQVRVVLDRGRKVVECREL